MARVFLTDETYNAASDDAEINGSAGTEQVNVFAGVTGLDVRSSVERVDLPGDIADFTFSSFGNSVTILDGNGDIVAQISGADGKQLVFGDGSVDVAFDAGTGDLTVGGETVGSTAAAITPAASEIDDTTTSETADGTPTGGPGQTFTLTAGADITGALEGSAGTTDTSGDDTFTGALGTFDANDVLIGGAGTDTLTADVDGSGAVTAGTVAGIETITLNNTAFDSTGPYNLDGIADGEVTINNTAITGATTATANNTGNIDLIAGTNVDTLTVLQKEDATTNIDAGAAAIVNVTNAAGAADEAVDVTVNGDTALNVGGAGITDVAITSTVASEVTYANAGGNVDTITADANTTLVGANDINDFGGDTITGAAGVAGDAAIADLSDVEAPITVTDSGGAVASLTIADGAMISTEDTSGTLSLVAVDDDDAGTVTTQTANVTLDADVADILTTVDATDGDDVINAVNVTANVDQTGLDLSSTADNSVFTFDGAGNVTLVQLLGATTGNVIDASGLAGDLTATANLAFLDITGGAGNDEITASGGSVEFDLDGGAGSNTLVSVADMTEGTFENFALLQFTTGDAFTASQLNGLTIVAEGVGNGSVDIGNADIDSATIDLSGITFADATDGVDMTGATEDTSVITTGSALTITGSNGADILLGLAGDDVIDGGAGNDFVSAGAGDDSIDGGEGNDNLGGNGGDDVINGGAGDDDIAGDAGADVMTGGDGADTFTIGNGDSGITLATADSITDFVAADDSLSLGLAGDATDPAVATTNYVEANTAVADFDAALTAANTALATLQGGASTAAELYAFEFDATNGYLFNDTDADGAADQVIVLVGIDNTEISAADIIA